MNYKLLFLLLWNGWASLAHAGNSFSGFAKAEQPGDSLLKFKPHVQVGGFLQVQGVATQDRPVVADPEDHRRWAKQAQVWRARFMVGGAISRKTSFFMQTDLPAPLGFVDQVGRKNMQSITPILLDAQAEHTFNRYIYPDCRHAAGGHQPQRLTVTRQPDGTRIRVVPVSVQPVRERTSAEQFWPGYRSQQPWISGE